MAGKEGSPPVRSEALKVYEDFNRVTAVGWLAVGILVPELAALAITMALVDAGQVYAINKWNTKPKEMKPGKGYALAA